VDAVAVEQKRCTTAVSKNMLLDASQVILYNLIVWVIQQARELRGREVAECSCDTAAVSQG
jgi:hypothetical protein